MIIQFYPYGKGILQTIKISLNRVSLILGLFRNDAQLASLLQKNSEEELEAHTDEAAVYRATCRFTRTKPQKIELLCEQSLNTRLEKNTQSFRVQCIFLN